MTVTFQQLALDVLVDVGDNIRQDLGDLSNLAASLKAQGMMQPVVVDRDMRIVSGHRRAAAARLAGLADVPVLVNDEIDDVARLEMMIVENLQRSNLSPLEEAAAFRRLCDLGHTQRRVADRIGCAQAHVSRRISLLSLPPKAHELIVEGTMTLDDAHVLARATEDELAKLLATPRPHRWAIEQAVQQVQRRETVAKFEKQGKASGLIQVAPSILHKFKTVADQADATHWAVQYGTLVWLVARPPAPAVGTDGDPDDDLDDDTPSGSPGRDAAGITTAADAERERQWAHRKAVDAALKAASEDRHAFLVAWLAAPKNYTSGKARAAAEAHIVHVFAMLAGDARLYADPGDVAALLGLDEAEPWAEFDTTNPYNRVRSALAAAFAMGESAGDKRLRAAHFEFLASIGRPTLPVEQHVLLDGKRHDEVTSEDLS